MTPIISRERRKLARRLSKRDGLALALGLAFSSAVFADALDQQSAVSGSNANSDRSMAQVLAQAAQSAGHGNPSLSLSTGNGDLQVGKSGVDFHAAGSKSAVVLELGVGTRAGLTAAGSYLLGDHVAVGGRVSASSKLTDAVLNAVGDVGGTGIRLQGALGYMYGKQDFDFFRSQETATLSQESYLGAATWINPAKEDVGMHSFGVSAWGAHAKNHSQFDTVYYVDETNVSWIATQDQRLISAGRLVGGAINMQYAPHDHLVVKGSVGMERLSFPYSDGSADTTTKPYADMAITYGVNASNAVTLSGKTGAAERTVSLAWQRPGYALTAYNTLGVDRHANSWGVGVKFDVLALIRGAKSEEGLTLAHAMRPKAAQNPAELLQTALSRPEQLPSTFLAKVDPTGVKQTVVEKSGATAAGVTVDAQGNLRIPVGTGQGQITALTRNGNSFSSTAIRMESNVLVVHLANLPRPSKQDTYAVEVTDSLGVVWSVNFDNVAG